jgi:hypothetical protein
MWLSEVQRSGRFNIPRFFLRRFLRIWPAMAVSLGVKILYTYAMTHTDSSSAGAELQLCKEQWWKVLLAINNWLPTTCMVSTGACTYRQCTVGQRCVHTQCDCPYFLARAHTHTRARAGPNERQTAALPPVAVAPVTAGNWRHQRQWGAAQRSALKRSVMLLS